MKRIFTLLISISLFTVGRLQAQTTLSEGDIAIVGYQYSGTPDAFSILLLKDITANTVVYFTDNGWIKATSLFRGSTATDGDGNENLLKFTASQDIPAGTFIRSDETSSKFVWTKSGSITGTTSGSFADLSLSSSGDQIYCFQGPDSNPLNAPSSFIFVLDFSGDGFEDATTSATGNIPTTLTLGSSAVSITYAASTPVFYLNPLKSNFYQSRTKDEWLTYIATPANWVVGATPATTDLPSSSTSIITLPVTLKSISASLINNQPQVNWETSNETNFDYFGVEKSFDAKNFAEIARVASNKASNGSAYQYADINKTLSTQFYRLKMVDNDGTFKYSSVVAVNAKPSISLALYPNPVTNTIILSHPKAIAGAAVKVTSIDGKILSTQNVQTGATQTSIDATRLVKGNYVVSFVNDGVASTTQFIKQ